MSSATVQSLTCRDTDCGVLWEDRASTVSVNYLPLLLNTESHEIEPGSVPTSQKVLLWPGAMLSPVQGPEDFPEGSHVESPGIGMF